MLRQSFLWVAVASEKGVLMILEDRAPCCALTGFHISLYSAFSTLFPSLIFCLVLASQNLLELLGYTATFAVKVPLYASLRQRPSYSRVRSRPTGHKWRCNPRTVSVEFAYAQISNFPRTSRNLKVLHSKDIYFCFYFLTFFGFLYLVMSITTGVLSLPRQRL